MEIKLMENTNTEAAIGNITKEIISRVTAGARPRAIILLGSFGTGEVSALSEEARTEILSDCEISIVPNKPISKKCIEAMRSDLSRATGLEVAISINHILRIYSCMRVPRFISQRIWKPTILKYNLKHGSKIISGDDYLLRAPDLEAKDLPSWEGVKLMFNRMAEALKYFQIDSPGKCTEGEQKTVYWISKVIIACQDALLLSAGKYDPTYRGRNNLFREVFPSYFRELYERSPNLLPLTLKATNYKLSPKKDIYEESTLELWFITSEICDRVFRYLIKKEMGITFDKYSGFPALYLSHPKVRKEYYSGIFSSPFYANTKLLFRFHKIFPISIIKKYFIPWDHLVYSIIPLVYFNITRKSQIDIEQLKQARSTLGFFKKLNPPGADILEEQDYIKKETFDLWHNICC